MKLICVVAAVIFGAISWICTQTVWEYQYIIHYIALFLASWCVCLVFLYQEENEISKKFTVFMPANIIYFVIIIIALIALNNYSLADWQVSTYSFWKAVIAMNGIQGICIIIFYKIRDWYHHM